MPRKLLPVENIYEVTLPEIPVSAPHLKGYQAISHLDIINMIKENLDSRSIFVKRELYKATKNFMNLQGVLITDLTGPENTTGMDAAIFFTNSYDRTKRFSVSAGAIVLICTNGMIAEDVDVTYSKKHVGHIIDDAYRYIDYAATIMPTKFNRLLNDKSLMLNRFMTLNDLSKFVGSLYIEHDVLTTTQVSKLKDSITKKLKENHNRGINLWEAYNSVTDILKYSHPKTFIEDHRLTHTIAMEFVS